MKWLLEAQVDDVGLNGAVLRHNLWFVDRTHLHQPGLYFTTDN
jgi:hypothetical protein